MGSNLRNFRLDDETWEAFKTTCEQSGSTASKELAEFCRAYIEGQRISKDSVKISVPTVDTDLIDLRVNEAIAPLRDELAALRDQLGKLPA
jgi:hypothetical protein